MKPLILIFLAHALCTTQAADIASAATAVRQGRHAEALQQLASLPYSPEAGFWRGRALIGLKRPQQALPYLKQVPEDHPLYPYAAKALVYCAWASPHVDAWETLRTLAQSSHSGIATLAQQALAELEHRRPAPPQADEEADTPTPPAAQPDPGASPLQQIDTLRQQRLYTQAIELCRNLESDLSLPTLTRQRIRLALADVYYEQEASLQAETMTPEEKETLEQEDGKGEETLLQFISANPDSPLMEEAFRRLHGHQAFILSKYAFQKLQEWMEDTARPRRAALAMQVLQHLLCPDDPEATPDPTYANTASSLCPREPATQTILQEHVRRLLARDDLEGAQTYLRLMEQETPRKLFYQASAMAGGVGQAAEDFFRCAEQADEALRPAALANALACALGAGQLERAQEILDQPGLADSTRALLLLTSATYYQRTEPERARRQLEEALDSHPDARLEADIRMSLACLALPNAPGQARHQLETLQQQGPQAWSEEQERRFYALWEATLRAEQGEDAWKALLPLVHQAATQALHPAVRSAMTLHEAELLAQSGQRTAALATLQGMLRQQSPSSYTPLARLLKARLMEQVGTLNSLKQAALLYAECSRPGEPYATEAVIARAAILARINHSQEAITLLQELLRQEPRLTTEQRAHALSVLADAYAADRQEDSPARALQACGQALQLPGLPRAWEIRCLLQRAALHTRRQNTEAALTDYRTLLDILPQQSPDPTAADWQLLYLAGSNAVSLYEEKGEHLQAAELAEAIAHAFPASATPGGAHARRFTQWAARIRQTNFLPASQAQRQSHQTAR